MQERKKRSPTKVCILSFGEYYVIVPRSLISGFFVHLTFYFLIYISSAAQLHEDCCVESIRFDLALILVTKK